MFIYFQQANVFKSYWEHCNPETTSTDLELETHYLKITAVDFREEI